MMEYYHINAAQMGLILTMQAVGGLVISVFLLLRGEMYNKINLIAIAVIVMGISYIFIGFTPAYMILIVVIVFVGVGGSMVDSMLNSMLSDVYPKQKSTLIPLGQAFFSIGAISTPVFVTMTVNPGAPETFSRPYGFAGIFAVALFLLYLLSARRIRPETTPADRAEIRKRVGQNPAEVLKTKKAWVLIVISILYFTSQLGLLTWLPTYMIQNVGADFKTAGLSLTVMLAGALPMRVIGPLILKKMAPRTAYFLFGCASFVLMMILLFMHDILAIFILLAASGFLQGLSSAILFLLCTEAFPGRSASGASLVALSSCISVLTAPLWTGWLSEYTGFRIPLIICACAFAVSAVMVFLRRERAT